MKLKHLLLAMLLACPFFCSAQSYYYQYFDGADTATSNSIMIHLDADGTNARQIGKPQKTIFNSAATVPNAMVTDTLNSYPVNDTSTFWFSFAPSVLMPGIIAVQWKQKIDLDKKFDGGIIEYSMDSGASWHNVFNNPNVYNFYGFDPANKDTLASGEYAFSGTDTAWRDVWLCFTYTFATTSDSILLRFKLVSDDIDSAKEGWMIDNLSIHRTMFHTVTNAAFQKEYVKVYPTLTSGLINIKAEKQNQFDIIEKVQIINTEGKVVKELGQSAVDLSMDIGDLPSNLYYVKVKTNIRSATIPVILKK